MLTEIDVVIPVSRLFHSSGRVIETDGELDALMAFDRGVAADGSG
jgi:hypothetical protein